VPPEKHVLKGNGQTMKQSLMERYTLENFRSEAGTILSIAKSADSVEEAGKALYAFVSDRQYEKYVEGASSLGTLLSIVRDCARAWRGILISGSEKLTGFSTVKALWDLAQGNPRPDLRPGFYAEMIHLAQGVEGRVEHLQPGYVEEAPPLADRELALRRSEELDQLWAHVEEQMSRYEDGLGGPARRRRLKRQSKIRAALGGTKKQFEDWRWQVAHICRRAEDLERLVSLTPAERDAVRRATRGRLPFGVTPYYASLFDETPGGGRDRAVRAQVLPPPDYVDHMLQNRDNRELAFDFMLEHKTSPIDLITRRYPSIAILKPYNACPQICVYCQRNWEIDEAMAPNAFAKPEEQDAAIEFIAQHPALREILVTGGDPCSLKDEVLLGILHRLAAIPHIDVIRIGTRTPVTMPMRFTPKFIRELGKLRRPGHREVCVVTHVEHAYEITPEMVAAVNRLKRQGISVFNQQVYTFYVSRRFETAKLRMLLRRIGIDPYYTFVAKGKEETNAYRVPLARLLQENKEEARLLPGSRRTDETVYNVPGLGKNYLRASQHRDLVAIMPDGARAYKFHPWEKGIINREGYVGYDIPILDYLARLEDIGEDAGSYESIWYYY
jgi:lysine 2,3-aminomutase